MISFEECKKRGKIVAFRSGPSLVSKELETAEFDLNSAIASRKEKNYKWAIIQAYFSIFHCSRALLFDKKFNEHSHICLYQAIKELFGRDGEISKQDFDNLMRSKSLREAADYNFKSDAVSAKFIVKFADDFLKKCQAILTKS